MTGPLLECKFYPNVIEAIKRKIHLRFPNLEAKRGRSDIPKHLLWMMLQLQGFDDVAKRGRWIGWIIAHAEILKLVSEKEAKALAKKDSNNGYV